MERQTAVCAGRCLLDCMVEGGRQGACTQKVAEIGLKVATHLEDKRALVRYAEAQEEH